MAAAMAKGEPSPIRRAGVASLDAFTSMMRNNAPGAAAAISYFSLLALVPSILLMVALADTLLGSAEFHGTIRRSILALFPGSSGFLASNIRELTDPSPPVVLSCLLIVGWSSTWIFVFLERALNRAWGVPKHRTFWQSRIRGLTLLILCGMLLLSISGITAAVSAIRTAAVASVPEFAQDQIIGWLWSFVLVIIGFCIAILVFFLVYKLLPHLKVRPLEALSGALFASFLWEGASYLFAVLVPYFNYQRVYGRMSAFVALLVWVYTSSLIIIYGAHYSAMLHKRESDSGLLFQGMQGPEPVTGEVRREIRILSHNR